jgi:hypothetical protein
MNHARRCVQMAAATLLLVGLTSHANAYFLCRAQFRAIPGSPGADGDELSCGRISSTTTAGTGSATNTSGTKRVTANKISGASGVGISVEGFDVFGSVNCSAVDLTSTGGGVQTTCLSTTISFQTAASY